MYKAATVFLGLMATTAISLASNMSGSFTWTSGTLTTSLTVTSAPQTVVLKVGASTLTFADTYVTAPPGTVLPATTQLTLLEKGSTPFAANFSTLEIVAAGTSAYLPSGRRSIPITSAGQMTANAAFELGATNENLLIPACTIGGTSFPNGVVLNTIIGMPSYSLTLPVGSAPSFNSVTFPGASTTPNDVTFTGYGNGLMTFRGTSMSSIVKVIGMNEFGAPNEITSASLSFRNTILAIN